MRLRVRIGALTTLLAMMVGALVIPSPAGAVDPAPAAMVADTNPGSAASTTDDFRANEDGAELSRLNDPLAATTSISGSAYNYYVNVSLFEGPTNLRGFGEAAPSADSSSPSVTLPPGGSVTPLTATKPLGAKANYGPAVIFGGIWPDELGSAPRSGPLSASTQSSADGTSVTSSTHVVLDAGAVCPVQTPNCGEQVPTSPGADGPGGFGPGPLIGDEGHSTCTASEDGVSGSATFVNGKVETKYEAETQYPIPEFIVPMPNPVPPNWAISGTIDHVGDNFTIILNEQILSPSGDSITVNAAHMYLRGPIAVGDMVVGSSTCTFTSTLPNAAPVAANDSFTTTTTTPLIVSAAGSGLLGNDTDGDGDAMSATAAPAGGSNSSPTFPSDPPNGTATINADGTFTYTADPGFVGQDSFTYVVRDPRGASDTATATIDVTPGPVYGGLGLFHPLPPTRILDTRAGQGPIGTCTPSPCAPVAAGTPVTVQVTGQGGVPASGVSSVVMNVTVTGPSADSFLTVWPSDASQPNASNLNFTANQTVPNLVTVKLGASGAVRLANHAGDTQVIADVAGWYGDVSQAAPGSRFSALAPARVLDTRSGFTTGTCTPSPCAPVAAGAPVEVQIAGHGGVPATGVTAVVMNATVTGASADSYLTVWPSDASQPNASNLNFTAGQTVPNLVVVKLSPTGTVKIANHTGSTNAIADVAGYYGAVGAATGSRLLPLPPARILETRSGITTGTCTPSPCAPVASGTPIEVQVAGRGGVPATGVTAVVMNVTVTDPSAASFLTVWPSDASQPNASNLNFTAGQTVPNLVTVKLSPTGTVKIANYTGSTNVLADVAGWYDNGAP